MTGPFSPDALLVAGAIVTLALVVALRPWPGSRGLRFLRDSIDDLAEATRDAADPEVLISVDKAVREGIAAYDAHLSRTNAARVEAWRAGEGRMAVLEAVPLDAEQLVRLVAAVVCETARSPVHTFDHRPDAVLLRLADAIGLTLQTEPEPSPLALSRGEGRRLRTENVVVRPYPARLAVTTEAPKASSSPDSRGTSDGE